MPDSELEAEQLIAKDAGHARRELYRDPCPKCGVYTVVDATIEEK